MSDILHSMTDLLELRPQLCRGDRLQALQLALIRHGPHEREARPAGEQRLDGLPDLHEHRAQQLPPQSLMSPSVECQ